jgi:hypothetical protein
MCDSQPTAFVAGGTVTQPQRYVIGDGDSLDDVQASGAWLASDTVREVRE